MFQIGKFEMHIISDGFFSLDGGSMFGIVPKVIWEKLVQPDQFNRVRLSLNCLLIKTGKKNILVETGVGNKYNQKWIDMYEMNNTFTFSKSLKSIGLGLDDIDIVVVSHLHFDHAGGATFKREDDKVVPTFPKAKYFIQQGEWEAATNPDDRSKGSYISDDFMPLADAKQIQFIKGDTEIEKGVSVKITGGHTKHHQAVIAESEDKKAIFLGCVMPTTKHIKPAYVMAYDLFPQEVVKARKEFADWAINENAICVWIHDPQIAAGYIRWENDAFKVEQVEAVKQG